MRIAKGIFALLLIGPSFCALAQGLPSMTLLSATQGVFNVADFGAQANDGLLDDEGVQAALAAAQSFGGTLYFPPGVWELSDSVVLSCDPGGPGGNCQSPTSQPIKIRGSQIRATEIHSSASKAFSVESGYQPVGMVFEDFWLRSTGQSEERHGIFLCDNNATVALTIQRVQINGFDGIGICAGCLLYTSPSPRDLSTSRMPSSA